MPDETHHMMVAQPTRLVSSRPVTGRSHTSPDATDRTRLPQEKGHDNGRNRHGNKGYGMAPFQESHDAHHRCRSLEVNEHPSIA